MGDVTKIQWCDHTFNPWTGCQKVSPGCANCYAEDWADRFGREFREKRTIAAESTWRQPLKWNREAKAAGVRRRVFCASLGDVFENRPELVAPRQRLFELIGATPHLDWLLLTKRPENIVGQWSLWSGYAAGGAIKAGVPIEDVFTDGRVLGFPRNVWIGTSVEDQAAADTRIPILLQIPAAVRFLSCEPLIGAVDLNHVQYDGTVEYDVLRGTMGVYRPHRGKCPGVDWVIVGGESGPGARECHVEWIESIVRQCQMAKVPVFVKQLGAKPTHLIPQLGGRWNLSLADRKGGDPAEWGVFEHLNIRKFPVPAGQEGARGLQ